MSVIDSIEVTAFTVAVKDFARDYKNDRVAGSLVYSPGATLNRPALMVRIRASDGNEGEFAYWARSDTASQAIDVAKIAVGKKWTQRELIFTLARRQARPKHCYGLSWIDNALWDLAGKSYGASLTEMLGGHRDKVQVYAASQNGDRRDNLPTKEKIAEYFQTLRSYGVDGFKIHSWHEGNRVEEAENVAYAREQLGDDVKLMLDPACVFDSLSDAIYVGQACEDNGYAWYEDPLRPLGTGIYAHKKLRDSLSIPILQTEHVPGPESKADFLLGGGTDIMRVDSQLDLGVTGCVRTINFAKSLGIDTEPHGPGPVHRHLIAAMQGNTRYEIANVSPASSDPSPKIYTCGYSDDITKVQPDGTVPVPQAPGIGVQYDTQLIQNRTEWTVTIRPEAI